MNEGPWWKANTKASGAVSSPQSGYATTIKVFFALVLIWQGLNCEEIKFFNHVQFTTLSPAIEFDYNPFVTFLVLTSDKYNSSHMKPLSLPSDWVMLLTERQTNKEIYLKHNFLCKGGNKESL